MNQSQLQEKSKDELLQIIAENEITIESLRHQLNNALRHRFGKKSEKDSGNGAQLSLLDEAAVPENVVEIIEADETISVPAHQRKKPGRKPLPKDLPRVQKYYDLEESEKVCSCGCLLSKIGEEKTEQLDIIPAKIQVIENIKLKYACKSCEGNLKTGKAPIQPIPKSIASAGLLAHIIVSKYKDHLPLYRQENMFNRLGIDIPRNTLAHWMIKSAQLLEPLYKLGQYSITKGDIAYADETRLQVLKEKDRPPDAHSFMWIFIGGEPNKRFVLYHYNPSRAHTVIRDILEDFKGWLHADGFSAYDTFACNRDVKLVGCWMHCRRKFYEITKTIKSEGFAHQAIRMIAKLYKIEDEIKTQRLEIPQIFSMRQEKSKPILKEFRKFIDEGLHKILPKSPLGQAFSYAHNQWEKLIRYIDDGRLEIDNGLSERTIKQFVIGRKNWMFCDSIEGAKAAEVLFSLIETCVIHGVEPYTYLRHVLSIIPNTKTESELELLMPYNIKL